MKKYLVIGNPIEHSLSPKLHNHWIKENNIDAVYDKKQLNENDIEGIIDEVKNEKIDGINVTVPFKKSVISFLDELTSPAHQTQSVNTIFRKDNKVIGDNTDIGGFELGFNHINYNLKTALIAEANLFLMPSRVEKKSVEGFGISFIEAASYGVGSIGGKDGGASDAIAHNKTGLICDGNNLSSIYDSVVSFFENENYVKYGKNAQEFSEKFHWDKVVKNYLKLIN